MSIQIQCPSCSKRFRVEDRYAGKRVKCRNCGGAIPVPQGEPDVELDELESAGSSLGASAVQEYVGPTPADDAGDAGAGEELPAGFGAALNAARGRASNRRFSLAAYPGAAVAHRHLPWVMGLVCLGFTVYLLVQKTLAASPQWPTAMLAGTAVLLFFVLVIPLTGRGLRRASQMLKFDLADGTLWRVLGLFSLPLLLATMLSDSPAGIVFGLAVGILMLMPLVWATFQLHWVEAVVAWMMCSLFFAGSSAAVGGLMFLIGLGVAVSELPEATQPKQVAANTPPVVKLPATQPADPSPAPAVTAEPAAVPAPAPEPAVAAEPLEMPPPPATTQETGGFASIFELPAKSPEPTPAPAPEPAPAPPAESPEPPPAEPQPLVITLPSPIVAKVTELSWLRDHTAVMDLDSLQAPMAVLNRTPEAESISLLGPDKPTGSVSFRKDPAGSDRYVLSPDGTELTRAVTWPKPGLQAWSVADGKPGKMVEVDNIEAELAPLCYVNADQVLVHRWIGEQSAIQVYNVKTGQKVREQRTPTLLDNGYAISPDGKTLAVAAKVPNAQPQLHLIDLATGRSKRLAIPLAPQWPVAPAGVAFSLDSAKVAILFEQDGNVLAVAWNTAAGTKAHQHIYPAGTLPIPPRDRYKGRGLDWLADGTTWLICGSVVIDVPTGQALGSLRVTAATNQRVVYGKTIYLEAAVEGGAKRIVTVDLNAETITRLRASLGPAK